LDLVELISNEVVYHWKFLVDLLQNQCLDMAWYESTQTKRS